MRKPTKLLSVAAMATAAAMIALPTAQAVSIDPAIDHHESDCKGKKDKACMDCKGDKKGKCKGEKKGDCKGDKMAKCMDNCKGDKAKKKCKAKT